MNELMIFKSNEFGDVRTVVIDNEVWFVGKDVSKALGYANAKNAVPKHVEEDDRLSTQIEYAGQRREVTVINESGLYALIFGSKLESAKRFKHWVTSEVLPTLRKTGSYNMENYSPEMQAILMHDKKLVKIESRVDKIENDMPLFGCESDELSAHVKRKVVELLGGKDSEAYKDKEVRSKLFRDIYNAICREFGLLYESGRPKSYKNLKRRYLYDAHEYVDGYQPPMYLREMIEEANAQMRMAV